MRKKVLFFLLLLLTIFPIARTIWQKWEYYLSPFDLGRADALYNISQYVKEEGASWIPDEILYSYAGWYYFNGGSPILVNPENPPLGKYLIGASIKVFNNDKIPSLVFGFLSIFTLYFLSRLFFKKSWLALLPVILFVWSQLFQEQFIYLPLFETFALTFLNLTLYFFIKAQDSKKYFWLSSFFLGALWATKPWMLTIALLASWLVYFLLIEKKFLALISWLTSLSVTVLVLLLFYLKLLLEGWGIYKVLSVQKWILWYHQSKLIKFGSVWPFIYLNRWHVWWGDKPYLPIVQWNFFWPIFTTLALIFSILVLLKRMGLKKKWVRKLGLDQRVTVLCLWVIFYLAFLSIGNINSRYVFYLLPFCYLLGVHFLERIWSLFVAKKFLNKTELELVEDELVHLFSALAVGLVLNAIYQDWRLIAVALFFGFLIDIDHWFDYLVYFGKRLSLKKFLNVDSYMKASRKAYVFLHGWEYIPLFWLIGRWVGMPGLEWAMSFSYLGHLLWDNFSFKHHSLAYFLSYRLLNNFSLESFIGKIKHNL